MAVHRNEWTERKTSRYFSLKKQGLTDKDIAMSMGLTRSALQYWMRKLKLKNHQSTT